MFIIWNWGKFYWSYMVTLSNLGRLVWLITMLLAVISIALINKFVFQESDTGIILAFFPIILIYVPIHMSLIYPSGRRK